jgi:hypothetical protein
MNGTLICVSNPGEAYVTPPALPPLAPSTATSAAPVPTNAKDELNRNCGSWFNVEAGDFCNLSTMRYDMSLEDFVLLIASINENCTNLLSGISSCVSPVGDSESSSVSRNCLQLKPNSKHMLWSAWLPYTRCNRFTILQSYIHSSEHQL